MMPDLGRVNSPEGFERAADYILTRPPPFYEIYECVFGRLNDQVFITGLLKIIGKRRLDQAAVERLDHLLHDLFMCGYGIAQGSGSGTHRAGWIVAAMRDWPSETRQRAHIWCGTAVEREILEPNAASALELAEALSSRDGGRISRALVIIAGVADKEPEMQLRPFGVEVLEAASESRDNGLAFLRVVTEFRGFTPPLKRSTRIHLAIETLVSAKDETVGVYVADWLLDQGHAEQAVAEALTFLIAHAPDSSEWANSVGVAFLFQIWHRAPTRLRDPLRDVLRTHLSAVPRDRREALAPMREWLRAASS